MNGEVQREPKHFGVTEEPDTEENSHCHHCSENDGIGPNVKDVSQQRPHSERDCNRCAITDWNVRQEIPALTHEKITTERAAVRSIEISAKDSCIFTNRTAQLNDRGKPHPLPAGGGATEFNCFVGTGTGH